MNGKIATVERLQRQYRRRAIWIFSIHAPLYLGFLYASFVLGERDSVILARQAALLNQIGGNLSREIRLDAIPYSRRTPEQTAEAISLRAQDANLRTEQAALQAQHQELFFLRNLTIPAFFLLLVSSWGCRVIARHQFRRATTRAAAGMCVNCGYDLRGSSDRCPECGTAFDRAARQS